MTTKGTGTPPSKNSRSRPRVITEISAVFAFYSLVFFSDAKDSA